MQVRSTSEIADLKAKNATLETAARSLRREIADLRNPSGAEHDDVWHLNNLLRAWDEAPDWARQGLLAIVKACPQETPAGATNRLDDADLR